jgi:hypothetical protein
MRIVTSDIEQDIFFVRKDRLGSSGRLSAVPDPFFLVEYVRNERTQTAREEAEDGHCMEAFGF